MEKKTALNGIASSPPKNHIVNFLNKRKTLVLNPAENELGRISKEILDKINLNLRNAIVVS